MSDEVINHSNILEGIVIAPVDLEAAQAAVDRIMELISQNDVSFAEGLAALQELQVHITAWEQNRASLHEVMDRIGMPLTNIAEIPAESE